VTARRPRSVAPLLVTFVTIMGMTLTATFAFAHAAPATISPGDGAVLNQAPARVVMTTTQDMVRSAGANALEVRLEGTTTNLAAPAVLDSSDRRRLTAETMGLQPGSYEVAWTTTSAEDGERDQGSFKFRFDPAAEPFPGTTELVAVPARGGEDTTAQWVLVAALAIGGLALVVFVVVLFRPRRT
jgi:methionine-rich copper-binding protein CopC